jgi:hypothetical protein
MPVKKNVFLDRLLQHLNIISPFTSSYMQNKNDKKIGGQIETNISGFYIFNVDTSEIIGLVISNGDKHLYISDIDQIYTKIDTIQKFIETGESTYTTTQLIGDLDKLFF